MQQSSMSNLQKAEFDPSKEIIVGQPVWLTQGSKQLRSPDFSPDGKWLTFTSRGKQEDLFIIRTDGTGLRQPTDDIHSDRWPRWSPDGKWIAFYSTRSGKSEIWIINPDGSGLQQLTHGSDGEASYLVWSPDGKRLAFYIEGIEGKNSFIMEIGKHWKEQTPQALPTWSNAIGSFAVRSWSPDGRKLAGFYLRADGFFSGITIYSFESQKFQQLVDFGIDTIGSDSVWLKDSRRMLFNHQGKIYLADTQSKKIREVLSVTPHEVNRGLTLSRDDRLIFYTVAVTEADIWLLSLE